MRGTFFQKPLEIIIETHDESWSQGGVVRGVVSAKSHDGNLSLEEEKLFLLFSAARDIKGKNNDKMVVVEELNLDSKENQNFEFKMNSGCPITEKTSSLYLAVGKDAEFYGHLQLNVKLHPFLESYFQVIRDFHRFQVKTIKNKKAGKKFLVDVTYNVPDTKDYTSILGYKVSASYNSENDQINLKHQFKLKKMSFDGGDGVAKDEKKNIDQTLNSNQFKQFGDSPNQDGIKASFEDIIDQVKVRPIL